MNGEREGEQVGGRMYCTILYIFSYVLGLAWVVCIYTTLHGLAMHSVGFRTSKNRYIFPGYHPIHWLDSARSDKTSALFISCCHFELEIVSSLMPTLEVCQESIT